MSKIFPTDENGMVDRHCERLYSDDPRGWTDVCCATAPYASRMLMRWHQMAAQDIETLAAKVVKLTEQVRLNGTQLDAQTGPE